MFRNDKCFNSRIMDFLVLGLGGDAWFVIGVVVLVFTLQLTTKLPSDFVFLGGMALLLLSGVIPASEVIGSFSSSTVVTVGALLVVICGLMHTGFLQWVVKYCLGTPKSYTMAIIRLMLPVAALSSFLNNTTVVALFYKIVQMWAKKMGIAPSKLLMLLSYASCMGGICTLIGTPPNMMIAGMYSEQTGIALSIFTPTLVGIFCLLVGMAAIIAMKNLIPERTSPEAILHDTDNYTIEFMVPTMSDLVGLTVEEAGLHKIDGGHIIEIIRHDKEIITTVSNDEFIFGGDRLIFAGNIEKLMELKESHDLVHATYHVFSMDEVEKNRKLIMSYVNFKSSFIGKRMCDQTFEKDNNVVLVAIARDGEVVQGSPREVTLKAGDSLLLECPAGFNISRELQNDMMEIENDNLYKPGKKTLYSSLIMIAMVVVSTLGYMSLLQASFAAAFAMILLRFCTIKQARESIDWGLLMIFAGSISLGTAIEETGIAEWISEGILNICEGNAYIALVGVCVVSVVLTEFASNTATAAIFFPIAYQMAVSLGVNPLTFCVALMIAVSSGYASPIGSPTHMLVYGPGGYRFADFFKIGIPLNIIILAANIFITLLLFPL